jgi:uncharacterized protein YjbJ (UPF0337 family)
MSERSRRMPPSRSHRWPPFLQGRGPAADGRSAARFLEFGHGVSPPTFRAAGHPPALEANPPTNALWRKELHMNWDRIEGNWKQLKGNVKEQWGKLTDDDFDVVAGRRDQLAGKLQERYGYAKDEAERHVAEWERGATDKWFEPKAKDKV